jgi:hypothetical protein
LTGGSDARYVPTGHLIYALETALFALPAGANQYDVSADGERFLMMRPAATAATAETPRPRINIVLNWFEELKAHAP